MSQVLNGRRGSGYSTEATPPILAYRSTYETKLS